MLGAMLIVPHFARYWHRRASPPIHQLGRVDSIHGLARQNLPATRAARRTRPLVWTGLIKLQNMSDGIDKDATTREIQEKVSQRVRAIKRAGVTMAAIKAGYDDFAEYYDEVADIEYRGHAEVVAEILRRVSPEKRPDMRVLDVGAGTGRVGRDLYKEGFRHLDAVDPSEGMMKKLRETRIYTNDFLEFIGTGHSTIPNDIYDLVVSAGAMGPGHIPVRGMDDFVRVTKKGGLVVIGMRLAFLQTTADYKDKLEPYMDELERNGYWRKLERRVFPNFFRDKDGVVFVFCVT